MLEPPFGGFKMDRIKKIQLFLKKSWKKSLIGFLVAVIFAGISPFFEPKIHLAEADLADFCIEEELVTLQENSLFPISNPSSPEIKVVRKIMMIITGYSSSAWETDGNPYITAAGTWVREGIVANNKYSFGTKIRIPEIFGDKVFVVEDRMHWTKGNYHIDIWFPDYWQALNFGAKRTYIEVLES